MNLPALLEYIDQNIGTKTGTDKITGAQHNAVLKEVVASLIEITGTGFGGSILPDDNPGSQTNPIYFLANQVGTYTYCGGLKVTALPAFIVWKEGSWKLNQIGVPTDETDDTGLRGIARSGDAEPSNPQIGNWYVYLDKETLQWSSQADINKPGIVRLESLEPSKNWVLTPFGDENAGGGIQVIEKRQERFSLIGHTTIPTAFEADVNISSVPKYLNLSDIKLVNISGSSEIKILTEGALEEMPIAVPAGDYNYTLTYEDGKESGVLLINFS